jgi:replicative DNA helicase Mcm
MDTEIVERYLRAEYKKEIGELRRYSSKSFTVDYKTIKPNSVAELVLSSNWSATIFFKDALRRIGVEEKILTNLQIRYINLPVLPIRNMKSDYVGQTRAFEGIVRRVSEVKSKATVAVFECSFCTKRVSVPQGIDITYPEGKCEWCERSVKWKVTSEGTFTDFQTVVVQEFPESIIGGDQPKSITTTLLGDLCSQVIPGNRITVVGTLKLKKVKSDAGLIFEPYMEGNSIIINDETYDDIKVTESDLSEIIALSKTPALLDVLSSSIAPTIYGNEEVKQGITLQMFGGSPKQIENTRIRPDIHVLLIGDPSTAKSAIMKHVISIVPRGVFTLGYSASKAGLTATAVKDEDGQWVLDAGALVLANNGMCAVDELDKMNENDRVALHGAMEQQEIDIAKAGIVAKLYTRCSLLAGANPKLGRFDNFQSLSQQFDLEPTLLSRFDLIYPIEDKPEQVRDSAIAKHILNTHMTQTVKKGSVPIPLFKKYISHARTINPRLTPEAASMIEEYYTKVRGLANNMNTVPITARSLEALIRLSEAAARMRLSETVTPDDAKVVITIVDGCLKKIAYDAKTNTWDIDKIVNRYSKKSANIIGRITDAIITVSDERGVAAVTNVTAYMKEHYNVPEDETLSHIELMRQETRLLSPRDGYIKVFK